MPEEQGPLIQLNKVHWNSLRLKWQAWDQSGSSQGPLYIPNSYQLGVFVELITAGGAVTLSVCLLLEKSLMINIVNGFSRIYGIQLTLAQNY